MKEAAAAFLLMVLTGALCGCAFAPGSAARMKAGPHWGEHEHDYRARTRNLTGDGSVSTTWPCERPARCP